MSMANLTKQILVQLAKVESRDTQYYRIAEMAGYDESGNLAPPTEAGLKRPILVCSFWNTKVTGSN